MQESERIRKILGISRAEFSRRYHIPVRTLEDWDAGKATPPPYVIELLERVVRQDLRHEKQGENDVSILIDTAIEEKDRTIDEMCQKWAEKPMNID